MTAADAFDVLYEWAKDMHEATHKRYEAAAIGTEECYSLSGMESMLRRVIKKMDTIRAEGFSDDDKFADLQARFAKQLEADQKQLDMLKRQEQLIDRQQAVIGHYEAMFDAPPESRLQ